MEVRAGEEGGTEGSQGERDFFSEAASEDVGEFGSL